ncbi:PAS domain S-box protein [Eubacteriaceae bacterium ES3]|nr:PAS domain S-box protein [Eubacteriaceae bacterium ES3]
MSDSLNKTMMNQLPVGYAYHKILLDNNGSPIDYEFLEINRAFEEFTGLCAKEIIGRKATEVIDGIEKDDFDWIREYGKIALEGGAYEIEQYSSAFDKWYQIHVISDERLYFATYFTDITLLREQLNDYRVLLNSLNDAVFELNDQLVFEKVLAPDETILLYPKEIIIGKSVSDLFTGEILDSFLSVLKKAKKTRKLQNIEYPLMIHGKDAWFRMNIRFLKFNQQEKFVISLVDITENIKTVHALTEKTNELERFFSVNLDLLCIANTKGEFIKVNKSWEDILGYSSPELEGRSYYDFVHPDDLEETIEVTKQLENLNEVDNFVNRYRVKDGSYKYIEWKSRAFGEVIYAAARDVTEKIEMEEQLFLEKERYYSTLLSIADGVIAVNNKQEITLMNKVAEELSGWKQCEVINKPFSEVMHLINEKNRQITVNPIKKALISGEISKVNNHTILIKKDQTEISIENSAAPIHDLNKNIRGAVLVFHDVTQKRKIQNEILYLSYHDFLTGLHNRRYFEEAIIQLNKSENLPISVIMLDVNGLKLTNDAFGHKKGDLLLQKVAEIIRKSSRETDLIARIGGDEFVMILPNTDEFEASIISKRLKKSSKQETVDSVIISMGIGFACKTTMNESMEEIIKTAENQMYKNKVKSSRLMRNQTINLIQETLNNKSDRERIHSQRVSRIVQYIGLAMDLPEEDVKTLETLGFLHDLGKIIVPEEVLNKNELMTNDEFKLMKTHTETGYQILKSVEEYVGLAEVVLYHHEWWNGCGYPQNLKGKEIPLFSRIIHVADAFEAMSAGRPYKNALNKEEIIAELKAFSGIQFDPEIIDVMVGKVLMESYDELNKEKEIK